MQPPEIPGARSRFVEINTEDAGRFRVHLAETGSGPPVLMLHGWPQHFWCWRYVAPRLADRFSLICPDLRGFGWSDAPGHGYDPETFAADAVALLDALELEHALLVGHDWGGYAGFLLALRHPDRIERFLALNTPVPWAPATPRLILESWRSWYAALMATLGEVVVQRRPEFITSVLRRDAVHPVIDEQAARIYAERLGRPESARATMLLYRSYMRAFAEVGVRRRYEQERLTVPTRLLFGAHDAFITTELIKGWEGHADDMAVELVEDSGHFIQEEKPELVAARAAELFEGVRAPG